jgi:lipopolysaccharide transport system permease protein
MKSQGVLPKTMLPSNAPVTRIEAGRSFLLVDWPELWSHRELLYFMIWRDVKVRYKQTLLGIGWAVLQPIVTMIIFTLIFSMVANVPSDGVPYPIFALAALVPWNYFASALSRATTSIASNANLITKIYFPRLFIPLSSVVSCVVDLFFSLIVLVGMMIWYQVPPNRHLLALPGFVLFAAVTAFAVGLWLSALNAKYRDVGHLIPFLVQCWLYASPVGYAASLVPEKWRLLYSINPMVGVIEGFRWAFLGTAAPDLSVMAMSGVIVVVLLFGGLVYFRRMEVTFADVV